jgi:hypothetical protein
VNKGATIEAVRGYSIERTAMLLDRLDEQGFDGHVLLGRIAVLSALAEGQAGEHAVGRRR